MYPVTSTHDNAAVVVGELVQVVPDVSSANLDGTSSVVRLARLVGWCVFLLVIESFLDIFDPDG